MRLSSFQIPGSVNITPDHFDCGISRDQTCKWGTEWDFVDQDYRTVKLGNEVSISDGHHQRMSVSVVAPPGFEPSQGFEQAAASGGP
jgi:hypothetical protein